MAPFRFLPVFVLASLLGHVHACTVTNIGCKYTFADCYGHYASTVETAIDSQDDCQAVCATDGSNRGEYGVTGEYEETFLYEHSCECSNGESCKNINPGFVALMVILGCCCCCGCAAGAFFINRQQQRNAQQQRAQQQRPAVVANTAPAAAPVPPPSYNPGYYAAAAANPFAASPATNNSLPPIATQLSLSADDYGTYLRMWNGSGQVNGCLPASAALQFFTASGLDQQAPGTLRTMWGMADTEAPAGQLNQNEFFRACKMVAQAQGGMPMDPSTFSQTTALPKIKGQ